MLITQTPPLIENTLSYVAGFIFLVAICIYIYLLTEDYKTKTKHTTEEQAWIYIYLVILISCFFFSYYFINKSNERIVKLQNKLGSKFKNHVNFVGKNPKIPIKGLGPLRNKYIV
jgi:amino acid permease